jgi:hypothetical protein
VISVVRPRDHASACTAVAADALGTSTIADTPWSNQRRAMATASSGLSRKASVTTDNGRRSGSNPVSSTAIRTACTSGGPDTDAPIPDWSVNTPITTGVGPS